MTHDDAERPDSQDLKMAGTWANKAVGRWLAHQREKRFGTQPRLSAYLFEHLGVPVSTSAISGWENGNRQMPAAVLAVTLMANKDPANAARLLVRSLRAGPPESPESKLARAEVEIARLRAALDQRPPEDD